MPTKVYDIEFTDTVTGKHEVAQTTIVNFNGDEEEAKREYEKLNATHKISSIRELGYASADDVKGIAGALDAGTAPPRPKRVIPTAEVERGATDPAARPNPAAVNRSAPANG